MTRIRIQVLALVALASTLTYAQQDNKKGYLTGSFETNTIYYKDDSKTKAESPEDHFGSNNYLNVPDKLIKELISHSVEEVLKKLPKKKQEEYKNMI